MTASRRPAESNATLLSVRVHPAARRAGVEKLGPREYKIHVTAPPEKGRANAEVLAALAAELGVPPSRLRLVGGAASRIKLVAVDSGGF
jgi:uncharacterized protein YggU (UPF0235/DUF167 family)